METWISSHRFIGFVISSILLLHLISVTRSSKSWGDVALPEDLEANQKDHTRWRRYLEESDDEDFILDEYSGEGPSGEEDGSTPDPPVPSPTPTSVATTIYYRALVNFTRSFEYSRELEDIYSDSFQMISDVIVDTLESQYGAIEGLQTISVVLIKKIGGNLFVELDVGSDNNSNDKEIRNLLYTAVKKGTIVPYKTSVEGFQFRRLGEVVPSRRACMKDEFMCLDGNCILLEYLCDKRPDCLDMSDEMDCGGITSPGASAAPGVTTPDRRPPSPPLPGACRQDQARCPSGECIPRDYLCDGEKDCPDGSDEIKCGTPSPCEPNEFKCQNGRCALKLWRCDGDNDCGDNSDESYCPTKGPGDTCAPEQFVCLADSTCIPASYQCDEESDCADGSDEVGCTPPMVTSPPEELISVSRGETVTFTCMAVGVPTPIITWRLNWGHIPSSSRITMTSENGYGTLVIRDVKDPDQGAYTCEAINAKGMVFGIPDGVLSLSQSAGSCPAGQFRVARSSRCLPCFCFGITQTCQSTSRPRSQIQLRFDKEGDFKGVNVSYPSRPASPPLTSNQYKIRPESGEFQLVDLSRRFLSLDSHWTLPSQFLGNKIDSYGGFLRYKVRYTLPRGETEPQEKPEVVLVGNGRRLIYQRSSPTPPRAISQKAIKFTEEHWQHSSGQRVTREDLMMTLVKLESINIRTMYDKRMITLALSGVSLDTTSAEGNSLSPAQEVEQCRCPKGYSGLSCEICSEGFEREPGGSYLGTCTGCNCNGHASSCDTDSGHCLNCRHNTEGPACGKCRPGYFGNALRGRPDDCKPCPCPYTETTRRFSATCFLDDDSQATCDACRTGYTGRRCERCAPGYHGNPLQPNGKCVPSAGSVVIPGRLKCDSRGVVKSNSSPCSCKPNVEGALCDECKPGSFHLSEDNPDGCLQCFCMGVTKTCASSTWNRDQVRGGANAQLFALSNRANTTSITDGIIQKDRSTLAFRSFASLPSDIYYWVLPESFRGDKVTAYGGELRYTVRYEPRQRFAVTTGQPDVILQGNGIFLEHFSKMQFAARTPTTIRVRFRESAWKRADGQPCTREHLLMALAEIAVFMIRATYADSLSGSSISDIQMDIAVPHSTGRGQALEVEECACPRGYTGPSCQECDTGYHRSGSGLYLGTCEVCDCNGHGSKCDPDSGKCLECLHNTAGPHCERCMDGFYGDPKTGGMSACKPCPCPGPVSDTVSPRPCYLDSDNEPTCESCPPGFTGRRCERCSAGYTGNPQLGWPCVSGSGNCDNCDQRGSYGCDANGVCHCKAHTEGPSCGQCKRGHFHLSSTHKDGCLPCFCMGVTQQCSSSSYYRETVSSSFAPGDFQGFALVNRQGTDRISTGFTVEVAADGTQLSFSHFGDLRQDSYYWHLPEAYQGDKSFTDRQLEDDTREPIPKNYKNPSSSRALPSISPPPIGPPCCPSPVHAPRSSRRPSSSSFYSSRSHHLGPPSPGRRVIVPPGSSRSSSSSSSSSLSHPSSSRVPPPAAHPYPSSPRSSSVSLHPSPPSPACVRRRTSLAPSSNLLPGRTSAVPGSSNTYPSSQRYSLVYKGFSLHPEEVLFWQLPSLFKGDQVGSYGGRLKYTLSYVTSSQGTTTDDADVQITGNDITLVARQPWPRTRDVRQSREFDIIFKEEYWRRPDGMPATREHLMMVLSDLDEILIRASHHTDMLSASISDVRMEVAGLSYSGGAPAPEVEQCLCPAGYQGLSCQDCSAGYTRTGTGLYLGHCQPCQCNGHSVSCHAETAICRSCLHNTVGEQCEQCAPGFYGDATTGTPEDCQPCACPYTDPDNQFSPTCEALRTGGYQCTACQPGYTGQYCERCAPGFVGNPQERVKCRPYGTGPAPLVVKIHPERVLVPQGSPVTLRCQVTSSPPHYYHWSREDGRPLSRSAQRRSSQQSEELHFSSVQPGDAGVYICSCQNQHGTNTSRAQIVVTTGLSKPIKVQIEEPKAQSVTAGSTASFICTAKSTSPAYTLVWTRRNNGKLPARALDFNGILTIQNIQPDDAGVYVCTASNMFAMDESTAVLYVPEVSQTQMFYTAYEEFEGHRAPGGGSRPAASISPPVLNLQPGQRAEFHCAASGTPAPAVEWTGGQGNRITPSAIIRGGVLIIPAVQRSDEAEYFCRALNVHGEHTARALLYVHSASLPQVQVSPQHVEVREGETMRLYCRAAGTPNPDLTWKKHDGQLPLQAIPSHGFHHFETNSLDVLLRHIEDPQARVERTDIGTLLVPNVQLSDSGTYLCVGTNAIGSSEARIEVTVVPGDSISSAVRIQPSIASVLEGQSLDLSCFAPGNPPPSVTWQRVDRPLSSNHKVLGSVLRIVQASEEDSGEYLCQVDGGPTIQQASVSVSVTSSSSRLQTPIISIEPHSTSVRLGESISFRCRVYSGAQPVRLEWSISNGQPLQDNVNISPDGNVITVVRSRPSNQGTYRCTARNMFGVTQSMASLIVKEPPRIVLTPSGVVVVKVGEPINLECKATGEPRPSVSWHRIDAAHRTVLKSPAPMESNAVMQVLAARPEDSGTYSCSAQNSEGSTEKRVEVMVQMGPRVPSAPRVSVPEPLMVAVEGQTVTLRCSAHGYPTPVISWSKLRAPLPWKHKVTDGNLVLPSIDRQDSGQYICNATNDMGTTEVTVSLEVETPPYASTLPDDLSVRVGEVIRLQCLAHGTPPLSFEWSKVEGRIPTKAEMQAGNLQINLAAEQDSGTYRCKVSNSLGSGEALAKVTVTTPLAVRVFPQLEVKTIGSTVEFTCSANGDDQTTIVWLKEGGDLPPKHRITDGALRLENLEQSDAGFYICRVTGEFGQAQDTAKLTIQALPKVMINIRTSVQTVMLGNSVEFECQAVGEPKPTVKWSKVGGSVPSQAVVRGGMLKIERVNASDAGHYRCTATNDVGSVQSQVVLNVQSLPQITAQPEVKDVTVGSTAVFPCMATGYPIPEVKWSKMDAELPSKAVLEADVLSVPDAAPEDMGTYVCTASNKQGKVQAFSTLRVHERVVPYFTQTPLSYLTLPTVKNSYKVFHVKVAFRPDTTDGMIVYNGQRKTTGADFISLGLVGGRPEFRFDVGSGMATIRYPTPIKLGEFHTVEIYRNQTQGSMVVDEEPPVNGSSQGKFQGLDLNEELYVGGYPNYSLISKTTGFKSGFVGCIRQLVIQGDEVIFKVLDRSSTGVSNCPTCKDRPCQNGGVCQDSDTSSYKCDCARGFTGSNCEHHSALHCHPEACGPDATCINRLNGQGYDCRCHLGKSGDKCMDGTLVTTPSFDGDDSFIAYPPLTNIHNDLRVELEFKPEDQEGLMFFSGGKKMKVEDFVSLSLRDGHVEFRYELGTGMALLRSQDPVTIDQWHRVTAERLNRDGSLKVDQAAEVRRSSPGKAQGLNIHTPLYLGGVPSMDILPRAANVSLLFEGCIGDVLINGKKLDVSYSFLESRAVGECSYSGPCERQPCLHGGSCLPGSERQHQYQCLCPDGFQGEHCEVVEDSCQHSAQCENGGSCVKQRCVCAPGYTGVRCENDSPVQYAAYFHDDGYLTLPKPVFPRSSPDGPETIELELRTLSPDGLVLWQGVEPSGALRKLHARHKELGDQGKGKDFISLSLENGRFVFSYQLGSGEAKIISKEPINDGNWHKLRAVRTGKQGYLQVDGGSPQRGQSKGRMIMVDTKGNIFLGGAPDMTALTGGKFSSGMTGCIKNLALTNTQPGKQPFRPIDLRIHAENGMNVERCVS